MSTSRQVSAHVQEELLNALRIARGATEASGLPWSAMAVGAERREVLSQQLYSQWYSKSSESYPQRTATMLGLIPKLEAAHAGTGVFDLGWETLALGRYGSVVAGRDGEQVEVTPPDYLNLDRLAAPPAVGEALAVNRRRDTVDPASGWWMTYGSRGPAPEAPMIRLFWNCPPDAVVDLVAALTEALELIGAPYTMKCPSEERLFSRVDAVVAYMGPDVFNSIKDDVRDIHGRLEERLRSGEPALTMRLGKGLAAAEDPSNGLSFGQSRCDAVADGVLQAHDQDIGSDEDVLDMIIEQLAAHGISASHPHLRADSPADLVTAW